MGSSRNKKSVNIVTMIVLGLLCVPIIFFWDTRFVYPLKIFVVLLHEISHGLAAVLTGGTIVKIQINQNQGGVCYTQGGARALILTAGYLGSMLWGGLILAAAARTNWDKYISGIIGAAVLAVTVIFIDNQFGLIYGIAFGVGMMALGKFAPVVVNDFVLKLIGLTSILYAIIDIKDDLISRDIPTSDAAVFAKEYFGTSELWGVIWIIIAIIMAFFFLRISSKGEPGSS
ncbi:MAG: M50 family metallopeptidase [bacterium]|nr:M50 family metallopeptidase [bacterium]